MIERLAILGAAVVVAMVAVALHDLIRRPGYRRLALRNLTRRRTETVLVVVGSSLGTAIIAAAFLVGATFHTSIRESARTRLGPVDEEVVLARIDNLGPVTRALQVPPLTYSDGVVPALRTTGSITATPGSGGDVRAVPDATVLGMDVAAARSFGSEPGATGLDRVPATLAGSGILLGRDTAGRLGVGPGDRVTLHAYGSASTLVVRGVMGDVGFGGMADAVVDPAVLRALAVSDRVAGAVPLQGVVFVSNTGGVFSGAESTASVSAQIGARLSDHFDVEVVHAKQDLLADADRRGRSMGQLFTGVGTFSVLAGLLLLVNLFVMMAEERKRELGLARATGLERAHLVRVFTLEGMFYAVAASILGCFLGAGVAWAVVRTASGLVGHGDDPFHLRLVLPFGVLATAGLIGFGLSMVTLWITSLRIARIDIVRAMRDLPDPTRRRHELRSSLPAGIGVAAGIALGLWGLVAVVPLAAVLGPPVALCAAIPLLRPVIGRRLTTALVSIGTLVWCIGVFTFVPRIVDHTGIPVYVVQGIVMVAAAVALATALDRTWAIGVGMISRTGRGLAARLGLAYPLEKVFRTGMLVGMYALIVFTLTFVSVYGQVTVDHAATITRQSAAGADVLVDASPSNPPDAARVDAVPGVAAVHTVWRAAPRFSAPGAPDQTTWPVSGFDASMLSWGVPHLTDRAAEFSSDRAVFQALSRNPHLIVIDDGFLDTTGVSRSTGGDLGVDSIVRAHDPITGRSSTYRVVGVTGPDITQVGSWISKSALRGLSGSGAVPSRFLVRVDHGVDPATVAVRLENDLVANGVEASTFSQQVADSMSVELGFLNLMQRYMAIGLIVGVAGLAVVMVRATRARRRQIGMLRVIGFSPDTVRGAFLVEGAFIAGQGIATGVGLGLLVSYQMLSRSAALGGDTLPYAVPWGTIGLLAVLPFLASLAVALIPASQASSVDPVEVLRMAE